MREPPAERILTAANDLFARHGVRGVGVDAIIACAGVAKASFYRHFPSKEDLVVAWLRDGRTRWLDHVVAEAERRADTPRARLLAFFDAVVELLEESGSQGCVYLNTGNEFRDGSKTIRDVVLEYLEGVERYLLGLVTELGGPAPELLACELRVICAGAFITASVLGDAANARAARAAVEVLLPS